MATLEADAPAVEGEAPVVGERAREVSARRGRRGAGRDGPPPRAATSVSRALGGGGRAAAASRGVGVWADTGGRGLVPPPRPEPPPAAGGRAPSGTRWGLPIQLGDEKGAPAPLRARMPAAAAVRAMRRAWPRAAAPIFPAPHTNRRIASSSPPPSGKRCFIGNLAWRTSWQDLKDKFREAGTVVYANVMRDESGV